MKKRAVAAVMMTAMILSMAGCGTGADHASTDSTGSNTAASESTGSTEGEAVAAETQQVTGGGTFTMPIEESISSLAWYNNFSSTLGEQTMQVLYDPLWEVDDKGETKYFLAESYELSDDGTEYTIHLRQDAKWHDGEPVTADDMIYTLDWLADPDCGTKLFASRIKVDGELPQYEKVDDYTVTLKIGRASNLFQEKIGYMRLLPKHIFENVAAADVLTSDLNDQGIGNGAYKLSEFVPGEKLTLVKNEDYYRGNAHFDTLEFRFIMDAATQEVAFRNGELSFLRITNAQTLDSFKNDENYEIHTKDEGRVNFLEINPNSAAMSDEKARQAVIYALDIPSIVEGAYGSDELAKAANSIQSPISMFYNEAVENYTQDLDTSKSLAQETGLEGQTLRLVYNVDRVNCEEMAVMIQSQLKDVGINVELDGMETSGFFTEYFYANENYDLAIMGVENTGDPGNYSGMYNNDKSGANMYTTDEVKNLWEEIDRELDTAKRQELINQVDEALKECYSCVPLTDTNYVFVTPKNFKGFEETDQTTPLFRDWLDLYYED